MGNYDGLGDICNYISSSLHLIVTYARYLETFKCQNVVYTLHGVWFTLHHHLSKTQGERNTMKTPRIYIGALAVFCIAALVIGSAGAAAMMQKGTGNTFKDTGGKGPMNGMANMTQLREFRTAHQDGFPAFANCTGKGLMKGVANETRMLEMLDNLTAKGYDVSVIRTAVEGGDLETAMTLLREFMTVNPDARPARGDGTGRGHMGGQWRAQNN
jgi:hypothetical protein